MSLGFAPNVKKLDLVPYCDWDPPTCGLNGAHLSIILDQVAVSLLTNVQIPTGTNNILHRT